MYTCGQQGLHRESFGGSG